MFPDIPNDLGNAKDWVDNARKHGLVVIKTPLAGTIVGYGGGQGYSEFGHVAAVTSVQSDGTFDVREMNFTGWNYWDTRTSTMKDVLGFIVPPDAPASLLSQVGSGSAQCHSFQWNIFGTSMCFDAVVGGMAIALGMGVCLTGVVLLVVLTLRKTSIQLPTSQPREELTATPSEETAVAPVVEPPVETPQAMSQARVQRARQRAASRQTARSAPSEATALRAEIRQARADRRREGSGGKGWVEATVRLNTAQNRLKALEAT